jgi:galactose mutarotase-like enzyme
MSTEPSALKIASARLSARISPLGAELRDLADARGTRLQWDGDPAIWAGRAPILFPIIGTLQGGRYRLEGRTYAMARHGIARHALFTTVSHAADRATLRLEADEQTRLAYPFTFRLDLDFIVDDATLTMTAMIANHDTRPMPASFGFHPALCWPLPYGQPRADHLIRFEHDEPAPIRRLDGDGLLSAVPQPTPVVGDTLVLRDALFFDDAMIFDGLRSRRLRYGAATGPSLDVRFDGLATLGVWTKPGADFICIEPWQGCSDPAGFGGELADKPGIVAIEPGGSRSYTMSITLNEQGD